MTILNAIRAAAEKKMPIEIGFSGTPLTLKAPVHKVEADGVVLQLSSGRKAVVCVEQVAWVAWQDEELLPPPPAPPSPESTKEYT